MPEVGGVGGGGGVVLSLGRVRCGTQCRITIVTVVTIVAMVVVLSGADGGEIMSDLVCW